MPTYDYVCDACGHQFEHRQSMSSNRLRTCPECKKRKLRRLIGSGAGVIFKGSGFYETDYRRKPGGASKKDKKGAAAETKPADSGSAGEGASKSDAKSSGQKPSTEKSKKKDD